MHEKYYACGLPHTWYFPYVKDCPIRSKTTATITYYTRSGNKENICCQALVELRFVGFLSQE